MYSKYGNCIMVAITQSAAPPPCSCLEHCIAFRCSCLKHCIAFRCSCLEHWVCMHLCFACNPTQNTQRTYCIRACIGCHPTQKCNISIAFRLALGVTQPKKCNRSRWVHWVWGFPPPNPKPQNPTEVIGCIGFGENPTNPKTQYGLCLG